MHYTYIVEYFLLYIIESIDTREVYRLLRRQLMEIISWKFGEQKEIAGPLIFILVEKVVMRKAFIQCRKAKAFMLLLEVE